MLYQTRWAALVDESARRRNRDNSLIHRIISTSGKNGDAGSPAISAPVGFHAIPLAPDTLNPSGHRATGIAAQSHPTACGGSRGLEVSVANTRWREPGKARLFCGGDWDT